MTKRLLIAAALVASTAAWAGSGSQGNSSETGTMLTWIPGMRAMHYDSDRNSFASDSSILVCPRFSIARYWDGETTCLDANKQNNWQRLESQTPQGMKIMGIDYRLSGSGGRRSLLVYYVPQ